MLNLGSLILGIGAWSLAVLAIFAQSLPVSRKRSLVSGCLCAVCLLLQILEIRRRVSLGDYAGIADTIQAVSLASAVLTAGTLLLNLGAYRKSKKFEVL